MWEKEFAQLGLNENEREVYLAVLKAGKIAPHRVAADTGVNRTTVYSIVKKLGKMGLIVEDLGSKVAYLSAEKPDALVALLEREQQELEKQKEVARTLSRELASMGKGATYSVPRIRFVEEDDLSDFLYKQIGVWNASGLAVDNTWWGYHDNTFTEQYGDWIDWSWKCGPPGMKVQSFSNAAEVELDVHQKHPDRTMRPLPDAGFDSSLWVIGDYTIMVSTRQKPHYLVEIHDTVLTRNQRQLFKSLWNK